MRAASRLCDRLARLFPLGICAVIAGCAIGPQASLRSKDQLTTFGANPQFDNERYEMVDLITLLDPENKRAKSDLTKVDSSNLFSTTATEVDADKQDAAVRQQMALAEIAFYSYTYPDPEQRRNRIQDRLIGASNQRCASYKVYLNRFDAYQQSGFGSATTLLGGAAGIVGGVKDARILGGLAGISSGVQAEIAQGFLGNLASYVIVPGIELRRKVILDEIYARRESASEYTLQAALADVARYHGACTLVVGLEQAKEAIQTVENPGMRMLQVTLNNVMQSNVMQAAITKQKTGVPLKDEDLLVPSFRVNGSPVAAATGAAGVRFAPSAAAPQADSPEALARRTSQLATSALSEAQAGAARLAQSIQQLQAEIETPTVPALTEKFKGVQTELKSREAKFSAERSKMADVAVNNAGTAAAALSCLSKLDQKLKVAEPSERVGVENDMAIAVALVKKDLNRWASEQGELIDKWQTELRAALDAAALNGLKTKAATEIDPGKLGKALDAALTNGTKALATLPTIDFKSRGVSLCS